MTDLMDIGTIIKNARKEKGLTQQQLADIIGVGKSAIAKWENGRVSEIKRSNLAGLADALGIRPYELVKDVEEKRKINPEESANFVADILLDDDIMGMISAYTNLDIKKRKQVMEYIHFLSAKK